MQPNEKHYQQHELSAAFPSMPGHDVDALAADIRAHGLREPITLFEDQVLDGWHRYRACGIADVEPLFVVFPADGDPVAFVKSRNLHRRHLSDSQRAGSVVKCTAWADRGARPAPGAGVQTTAQMAAEADVGERTIRQAKLAERGGLGDAVRDGKLSAKRAAEIVKDDPKVGKKIAAGKVTADEVIEKAAKKKAAEKPLPRPAPSASTKPAVAAVKCQACADAAEKLATLQAAYDELHENGAELASHVETLAKFEEGNEAAVAEMNLLRAKLETAYTVRDTLQTTLKEVTDQCKSWERKNKRLQGQLDALKAKAAA